MSAAPAGPSEERLTKTRALLERVSEGETSAFQKLYAQMYDELKDQAHAKRVKWKRDYTLNTTALVHEAYEKMQDQADWTFRERGHFLAVASKVMRHVLIDYARAKRAEKRGGEQEDRSYEELERGEHPPGEGSPERLDRVLTVNSALDRLEEEHPEAIAVLECRMFGGLTVEETAEAMGFSASTVKRRWATALSLLEKELDEEVPGD